MEGNVLAAAAAAAASHQHSQGVLGSILSGSGGANQGPPGGVGGPSSGGGEQPGPIRIRNLEDLIRQLEHSSRHLSSSPGSDEMGGGDHDRHFRYQLLHASFDFFFNYPKGVVIPPFIPHRGALGGNIRFLERSPSDP